MPARVRDGIRCGLSKLEELSIDGEDSARHYSDEP
jgi:hypothetical protein